MVSPNVLELTMPAVTPSSMDLDCSVGSFGTQSVSPVIAHTYLVAELGLDVDMWHCVHFVCSFANQQPKHFALGCKFDQRKLNSLVGGQWLAERLSLACVLDALIDAVNRRAKRGGCLPDSVLVDERLGDGEPITFLSKNRR